MTDKPTNPFANRDWFKKLSQPHDPESPVPEADWNSLFTDGASETAPAELPSGQRVAIAQMSAQFAEFQRVGFTRAEAYGLVQSQIVAAVTAMAAERFRRGQGGS